MQQSLLVLDRCHLMSSRLCFTIAPLFFFFPTLVVEFVYYNIININSCYFYKNFGPVFFFIIFFVSVSFQFELNLINHLCEIFKTLLVLIYFFIYFAGFLLLVTPKMFKFFNNILVYILYGMIITKIVANMLSVLQCLYIY